MTSSIINWIVDKYLSNILEINKEQTKSLLWSAEFEMSKRIIVKAYNDITKIFAAENERFVRIWNFHTDNLLNSINISKRSAFDICLWDNGHLFAGYSGGFKLVDIKNNKIIKNFDEKGEARGLALIGLEKYGKCLLTENFKGINLWINKFA